MNSESEYRKTCLSQTVDTALARGSGQALNRLEKKCRSRVDAADIGSKRLDQTKAGASSAHQRIAMVLPSSNSQVRIMCSTSVSLLSEGGKGA